MKNPPENVGPYTIDAEIGQGAMGVVYRARDNRLNRTVALKSLHEQVAADADLLARFTREAQALAALNHPNIAGIHGLEAAGDHHYLVLEYVAGETLAQRLTRGPLDLGSVLDVCTQIAAGLEAAHEAGIIHRDLKPDNLMITADGTVKMLDFGLAR
ncbi:serine/threonine-protein kinase, partial [bacterium]